MSDSKKNRLLEHWVARSAALLFILSVGLAATSLVAHAQSTGADTTKPISEMSADELAAYIKEQELQLEAVKQARDEQKAKFEQVQEALLERQEKLNDIVIELSELCEERKELDPNNAESCMPEG